MEICQWHISRDSKEQTEATAEGARGYVSERSETKDSSPPPQPTSQQTLNIGSYILNLTRSFLLNFKINK